MLCTDAHFAPQQGNQTGLEMHPTPTTRPVFTGLVVVPALVGKGVDMAKQFERRRTAPPKAAASKVDKMIAALRAPKGATLAQLVTITGWQPHSVRAAMSGSLKKHRGLTITSSKSGDNDRIYKIASAR
jgi:hypothetical protein